jgi:hypothetical protein
VNLGRNRAVILRDGVTAALGDERMVTR